ncbi:unnamed protein product [Allacma fusca]|uniref:Uncharacterized protein n=1 Tax=Allacma fusca TaxID=39272 RepID=A0A8J2PW04_9HEXA|nr:unnamed protein product [Allacma fusca]
MRKRYKSKHPSQLQIGSLGRKKLTQSSLKQLRGTLDTESRAPKFTSYVDQYTKSKTGIKLDGDTKAAHRTVPEGIQTEGFTREEEQANLQLKLQAREDYVRANTTKVLHWLFEKTDTKRIHEIDNKDEHENIDPSLWPGILALLTPKEFSLIRYPEWRLVINGNQFTIIGNEDRGNSFYRALAQAVTSNEDNADVIRRQLCEHVTSTNWASYERRLRKRYSKEFPNAVSGQLPSVTVMKLYRHEQLRDKKPGGYFQLRVAAEIYNFNFVIVFKKGSSVKWFTFEACPTDRVKTVAFFVWPMASGSPLWRILSPLDSTDIEDGEYPFFIKRTFPVQQCCYSQLSKPNIQDSDQFPGMTGLNKLVTLQAGKEEFEFPIANLSLPQTLYSLLSEILHGNSFHTAEIQKEVMEHRDRFEYLINLNPKRKNSKKKLYASHYRQDWGDAVDLKISASIYKFCYTVIAMDRIGNLSHISECRDRGHSHYASRHDINFLAFFTRVTPRSLAWFKLELYDTSRYLVYRKTADIANMRNEYFTLSKHRGPSTIINNEFGALGETPQTDLPDTEESPESPLE